MVGATDSKDFSVALLIEDIKDAKAISDVLREMGIFAHIYGALDEFWVAVNTHTPDLAIIDVKCMSQGHLLLRNHPKIAKGSMFFSFVYRNTTKALLNSTRGMKHFGLINLDVELSSQIQATLLTRNSLLEIESENKKLVERVERLQRRSARILSDVQDSYNFENQFQKLEEIVERMGTFKGSDSFVTRVSTLFDLWDECQKYSVYELNQTGQKLICPKLSKTKYKELPDLWLTRECHEGMEDFAVEMAEEVAFDIFDTQVRVLKISGAYNKPDALVIAAFDETKLTDFRWNWLEYYMNSMYRQLGMIKTEARHETTKDLSTFECMTYLDDLHFHNAKTNHKVFAINLAPLLNWAQTHHSNRFFWKAFDNDFRKQIGDMLTGDYKFSHYGAHAYVAFIELKNLEKDFATLRHFVSEFAYWRYFEDSSVVMHKDVIPQIKVLPPSAISLVRTVQGQTQKVQEALPLRRTDILSAKGMDM